MKKTILVLALMGVGTSSARAQDAPCVAFDRVTAAARSEFTSIRGAQKGKDSWAAAVAFPGFDSCELTRSDRTGVVYSCTKKGFATSDAAKDGLREMAKALLPCVGDDPSTNINDMGSMGLMMLLMRKDDSRSVSLATRESSRLDTEALKIVNEWIVTLNVFRERDR
jgi:hypothetical protein